MQRPAVVLSAAVLTVLVAGCAGGAGGADSDAGGKGYEYGASVAEVQAVFEDIEPITLKYQPSATSPEASDALRSERFVEYLEEMSGGKITVETAYGQSIASYEEVADALIDGRIDVAYTLPIYEPQRFPVFSGLAAASGLTGTSPMVDELASNAALGELAWSSAELLEEFEEQGLHPLNPINGSASIVAWCRDEVVGHDEWVGKQVRISSAPQIVQAEALGGSPVSMSFGETYEGLQRGAVDCTLSNVQAAFNSGVAEVAPHVTYARDVTFVRGAGAVLAGRNYGTYPLAVRQLLFDAMLGEFEESRRGEMQGGLDAVAMARESGGSFREFAPESEEAIADASRQVIAEAIEEGTLPEGAGESVVEALERWRDAAAELGYVDEGGFEDFGEWYDPASVDLEPFADRYFSEVMLPHRPE